MKKVHMANGAKETRTYGTTTKFRHTTIPTLCGSSARSDAKATTNVFKVTCAYCRGKLFGRMPTEQEWFDYLKAHPGRPQI